MSFQANARRLTKAARIILVGAPGVGKGTQTERLISRYPELKSIATGDLLRDHVKRKTSLGLEAQEYMNSGKLVPDPLILTFILAEMRQRKWITTDLGNNEVMAALKEAKKTSTTAFTPSDDPNASFILDGFPRTAAQAEELSAMLPISVVFNLVTPTEIILSRMANRWIHPQSGRVYNVGFNDPKVAGKDDVTGEDLIQREDDSEATWRKRLKTFDTTSGQLLDFYRRMDEKMVVQVKGNSSDEISPQVYEEIERRFTS